MWIELIAALDQQGGLGYQGKLPWHSKEDLKRFKAKTMGEAVIMGRKTFESLPHGALKGRKNFVLSRHAFQAPQVVTLHSVEEALALASTHARLIILGGGEIYRLFLPHATHLDLTCIQACFTTDCHFPAWNAEEWALLEHQRWIYEDPEQPTEVTTRYQRRSPADLRSLRLPLGTEQA